MLKAKITHVVKIILLILLLFFASVSVRAEEYTEGYFCYELNDGGATITKYFGNETDVVVPSFLGGEKVISLADYVFSSDSIQTITLSEYIETVGENCFTNSKKLVAIYHYADIDIKADNSVTIIKLEFQYADKEIVDYNSTIKPEENELIIEPNPSNEILDEIENTDIEEINTEKNDDPVLIIDGDEEKEEEHNVEVEPSEEAILATVTPNVSKLVLSAVILIITISSLIVVKVKYFKTK